MRLSRTDTARKIAWGLLCTTVLLVLAATVSAELTQKGNLFVRFDGGISPKTLPRHAQAPIAVRIEGTIRTPAGDSPPDLRRIRIALNREGRLDLYGLSKCRRRQLMATTPREALAACAPALVGSGGFTANTSFPDQPTYLLRGQILLFNSVSHRHASILAHIFQTDPVPITRFVVFTIRRQAGTFGTVITGDIPEAVNRNGYLKSIYLNLQRRYRFRGRTHAYLSAGCPAPPGFPGASFPFAQASMTFEDGRTLASRLTRTCRVR
jgi:hypothetical protein